jgi:hypothetical protein
MPWIFYSWFVFAALFIAVYFAWAWISSRRTRRNESRVE